MVNNGEVVNFFRNKDSMCEAIKAASGWPTAMHYSEMPVSKVKDALKKFRPTHRLKIGVLRKVLETGSLQSKHCRGQITADPHGVLRSQIRYDLTIRALMVRFLHERDGGRHILEWVEAEASAELSRLRLGARRTARDGHPGASRLGALEEEARHFEEAAEEKMEEMRELHEWRGVLFHMSENREAVAAAATGVSAAAGAAVAVATLGVGAPLAAGAAMSGGLLVAAPAVLAVGLLLLQAFEDVRRQVPGGGMEMLSQARWDQRDDFEAVRDELLRMDTSRLTPELRNMLQAQDAHLSEHVKAARKVHNLLKMLRDKAHEHARNVFQNVRTGIGCGADLEIGTDRHVFSIIGPHFGLYYGDICIVLRQRIMYDPDFDMTPCAGTSFLSGRALSFEGKPVHSWLEHGVYANTRKEDQFHMSRLNAGVLGWLSVMAGAVATAVSNRCGKRVEDVTAEDVVKHLSTIDSHCAIEGHLPPIVPLGPFVERILIPEATYDELTRDERARLEELVGTERIVKVDPRRTQSSVLQYQFNEVEATWEEGFYVFVPAGVCRHLRGVRPRTPSRATIRVRAAAPSLLVLGSASACIVIGLQRYLPEKGEDLSQALEKEGFPPFRQDAFKPLGCVGPAGDAGVAPDAAADARLCWLLSSDGAISTSCCLAPDEEGQLACDVSLKPDLVTVTSRGAAAPALKIRHHSRVRIERVAVKAGVCDAELMGLKVM